MTEFCENSSLEKIIFDVEKHPLAWQNVILFAKDVAEGMLYLHNLKPRLIHRDLKPDNVLVDSNYIAKVTDFGLSQYKNKNRVYEGGEGYKTRKTLLLNKNYVTFIPPEDTPTGFLSFFILFFFILFLTNFSFLLFSKKK